MGFIKWVLKLFSCQSSCKFNEQMFDDKLNRMSLSDFELKHKDIQTIHRILTKRKRQIINIQNNKIEIEV